MEKCSPIFVSVTGWSGSGKTTFCERLISDLKGRGFSVCAVKNSHRDLIVDREGSDSRRYYQAGADEVCLNAGNSMTLFRRTPVADAGELRTLFSGADFIIAEGFKADDAVHIEVAGLAEAEDEMKNPPASADLVVYGNSRLRAALEQNPPKPETPILIERDDIKKAGDFLVSILT